MTLSFRSVALLQLAVVLGIAAGFGFALWQKGEPVAFDRQATGVAPSMESLPQTPSPSVSPAVDANTGNSPQTLAEWLEGEVASTSSGSEQIRGVVWLEGEPLTGLEMTASVMIPSDIDEEADLVDQLLSRVRTVRLRKSLVRICISDEEGRFSFEGLDLDHKYHLITAEYNLKSTDSLLSSPYAVGSDLELKAWALRPRNSFVEKKGEPWATGGTEETVLVGTIDGVRSSNLHILEGHGPIPESLESSTKHWLRRAHSSFRQLLVPGPYTLVVKDLSSIDKPLGSWNIDVEPGFNELHLVIEQPSMEVVVSDFEGNPIEGASFSWTVKSSSSTSSRGLRPMQVEGNHYFVVPSGEVLEVLSGGSGKQVFLKVSAPGHQTVEVSIDRLERVDVRFDPVAWLHVDVGGYLGSGLEGSLSFTLTSDDGSASAAGMLDWLGAVRLGPVPPGHYRLLTLTKIGTSRFQAQQIATESVHLAAGDNAISLTLPALYDLTLDFDDELLGKQVMLQSPFHGRLQYFTASRPLLIPRLVAGEYLVRVELMEKAVRIPQQDSVFIAYEKIEINTMVIVQITPGSPAERSGLQVGDQVIAFNGVTFSGMEEMQAIGQKIVPNSDLTLTIIRNGVEMQLTVEVTAFEGIRQKFIER